MSSISFDRVAHAYDATRGYPPGVDQQIARAIVDTANAKPETTFMEVGVGTGRIAFPLASLGHTYTGVDISEKMVKLLATKLLENGWQQAVLEVLRVLRPGGAFLHCWDEFARVEKWPVGETWGKFVHELGGETKRPGASARSEVTAWLKEQGLQPREIPVVQWEATQTPREAVEQVTRRLWSSTWVVPDDIFAASVVRLESWAKDYYGADMDTPFKGIREFVICKTEV